MSKLDKLDKLESYDFPCIGKVSYGENKIVATKDRSAVFCASKDNAFCYFPLKNSVNCLYEYNEAHMPKKIENILMDLDGTSIKSEEFWVEIIEEVTAKTAKIKDFKFDISDIPYVSGYTVAEHLHYSLSRYAKNYSDKLLEQATELYYEITRKKLKSIEDGTYKGKPFCTQDGLKELLVFAKENGIKVCLVSSGLIEKARPEIISACSDMGLDIFDTYATIITGGVKLENGAYGTLGNYSAKPHPWLYFESLKSTGNLSNTIAVEDSSAGVLSCISAGLCCVGLNSGNINISGVNVLCEEMVDDLYGLVELVKKANKI